MPRKSISLGSNRNRSCPNACWLILRAQKAVTSRRRLLAILCHRRIHCERPNRFAREPKKCSVWLCAKLGHGGTPAALGILLRRTKGLLNLDLGVGREASLAV